MELHPPRRAALLKSVGKVLVSFGLLVLLLPALLFSLLLFAYVALVRVRLKLEMMC